MEMTQSKQKKPLTLRLSQFFIGVVVGMMAACLIFALIYLLIGLSPAEIPLAPGIDRITDNGSTGFLVKVGALRGTFSQDEVTLSMVKSAMYMWILRAEALLLTLLLVLVCLSRMMESIRVSGYIGTFAARQLALCGVSVIVGSTLCASADALDAFVVTRTFFVDILERSTSLASAAPAINSSFPIGAWIGGFLLILAASLCMRYTNPPLQLGEPKEAAEV